MNTDVDGDISMNGERGLLMPSAGSSPAAEDKMALDEKESAQLADPPEPPARQRAEERRPARSSAAP